MKELIENYESLTTLIISIVALLISIIALYYTVQAFLLKSGQKLRCDISTCSTIKCNDSYVASITLENIKDRATVIFEIYLKLSRGNYLLIESFENKPLILKPFEVYYKEFDPLLFYSSGMKKISLKKVLQNRKIKRSILLSTTDGKYTVKSNTKRWSPISIFFTNYMTAIIKPVRIPYKGKYYGDKVKYLVELKSKNKKEQVIDFYERDFEIKKFKKFPLTKESLESKKKLKEYLKLQREQGKIKFDKIRVINFGKIANKIKEDYDNEIIEIEPNSFLKYNIMGRIYTKYENYRLKIKNKKTAHNNGYK